MQIFLKRKPGKRERLAEWGEHYPPACAGVSCPWLGEHSRSTSGAGAHPHPSHRCREDAMMPTGASVLYPHLLHHRARVPSGGKVPVVLAQSPRQQHGARGEAREQPASGCTA